MQVFGQRWLDAQKGVIDPDPFPYTTDEQFKASVKRGKDLFARDEELWMGQFGLTDEERQLIRERDWIELWRHGMSIYTMIKLIGVTGTSLVDIGKQMREKGTREMRAHGGG